MRTATPASAAAATKNTAKKSEKTEKAAPAKAVEKASSKVVEKVVEKVAENRPWPPAPMEFDAFLAKLTPKDRLNVERHVAAVEEQSTRGHAKLWKRIACRMMGLAPHSAKANGQQSMQFYIADGKYRMQIFAMEDLRDGNIQVYFTDAIDESIKAGIISKAKPGDEPDTFRIAGGKEQLTVERLDGKVTNPAPFYKDMLGWNRRAAHIILPVTASDAQSDSVDQLLLQGAKKAGVK